MDIVLTIISIIAAALIGAAIAGYVAFKRGSESGGQAERERQQLAGQNIEQQAAKILAEAESEARRKELHLKEEEVRLRDEMDAEMNRRRKSLESTEQRLQNRKNSWTNVSIRSMAARRRSTRKRAAWPSRWRIWRRPNSSETKSCNGWPA